MNKIQFLIIFVIGIFGCNPKGEKINSKSPELIISKGVYHPNTTFDVYDTWKMKYEKPSSALDFEKIVERNPWKSKGFVIKHKRDSIYGTYDFLRKEELKIYKDTRIEKSLISLYSQKENGETETLINYHLDIILKKMVYDTASHWVVNELKVKIEHHPKIIIKGQEAEVEYDFISYTSKNGWIQHRVRLWQNIHYKGKEIPFDIDNSYIIHREGSLSYSSWNSFRNYGEDKQSIQELSNIFKVKNLKLKTTNLLDNYKNQSGRMKYIMLNQDI